MDDSGNGSSAAQLADDFPNIHWIIHEHNLGFGASANECVEACFADLVVLLNDDTVLLTDPSPHLQKVFSDETVFAATFQSLTEDMRFREGAKRLVWPMGFPRILHNPADQLRPNSNPQPSAYAVGGHAAFHRQRFIELGGFDPLFAPFYWEDADLGIRAQSAGLNIVYLPECRVIHDGASAIRSQHDEEYLIEITLRNRLLFAWRHARGGQRVLHSISLAYHFLISLFNPRSRFRPAFRAARTRYRQYC